MTEHLAAAAASRAGSRRCAPGVPPKLAASLLLEQRPPVALAVPHRSRQYTMVASLRNSANTVTGRAIVGCRAPEGRSERARRALLCSAPLRYGSRPCPSSSSPAGACRRKSPRKTTAADSCRVLSVGETPRASQTSDGGQLAGLLGMRKLLCGIKWAALPRQPRNIAAAEASGQAGQCGGGSGPNRQTYRLRGSGLPPNHQHRGAV